MVLEACKFVKWNISEFPGTDVVQKPNISIARYLL